jgi:hypothetical protein
VEGIPEPWLYANGNYYLDSAAAPNAFGNVIWRNNGSGISPGSGGTPSLGLLAWIAADNQWVIAADGDGLPGGTFNPILTNPAPFGDCPPERGWVWYFDDVPAPFVRVFEGPCPSSSSVSSELVSSEVSSIISSEELVSSEISSPVSSVVSSEGSSEEIISSEESSDLSSPISSIISS